VRFVHLLARLALVVCVSGVAPAAIAHPVGIRSGHQPLSVRRALTRTGPRLAVVRVSREEIRSRNSARGKQCASALPSVPALGVAAVAADVLPVVSGAIGLLDGRASFSPRAPPFLI
jgi:hypothetical protein